MNLTKFPLSERSFGDTRTNCSNIIDKFYNKEESLVYKLNFKKGPLENFECKKNSQENNFSNEHKAHSHRDLILQRMQNTCNILNKYRFTATLHKPS
jgi:hypothetical protein